MEIKKFRQNKRDNYFVVISKKQAMGLIVSLANQLMEDNPNTNRQELFSDKGEYFSIAVEDPERKSWCMISPNGKVFPGSEGFSSPQAVWNWFVATSEEPRNELHKMGFKAKEISHSNFPTIF